MSIFTFGPIVGPKASVDELLVRFWPVLAAGLIVSLIATPLARRLAFRYGILDLPNDTVKTHKQPTAYLGGLAVLVGFLAALAVGFYLVWETGISERQVRILAAIGGGAILSCIVGLIDDIKDLKPWQKLLGQALCSVFLVVGSVKPTLRPFLNLLGLDISEGVHDVLAYFTVLFFVLGTSNSLNLLDGLDGLCTGVTAIITIGFLLLAVNLATWDTNVQLDPIRIVVSMGLVGAALGFLVFNRHPAKIFLGDAGSILLGFIIASMMMLYSTKNPRWALASIMIFGLPILDTGTALIRRALNRRPLFLSDRGHVYDQMIDRGMPLRQTVAVNYALAGLYALIGIFGAFFMHARYAVWLYLAVGAVSFAVLGFKGYFRMSGLRGATRKQDA